MASDDRPRRGGLSSAARAGLVVGAVVVLVVAFVLARGSDEAKTPTRAESRATTTPADDGPRAAPDHADADDAAEAEAERERERIEPLSSEVDRVRVTGGQPVGGVRTLRYRRGDRIRLRVSADAADEVHVHGFDVEKPVGPSAPARFDLEADIEGRFEVELHGTGTQIALLEVSPGS